MSLADALKKLAKAVTGQDVPAGTTNLAEIIDFIATNYPTEEST